jgi:hypothetical protein
MHFNQVAKWSALKERQISARDEPAMERKIEPTDSGTKAPRLDGNLVACRSVLGQSVLRQPPSARTVCQLQSSFNILSKPQNPKKRFTLNEVFLGIRNAIALMRTYQITSLIRR